MSLNFNSTHQAPHNKNKNKNKILTGTEDTRKDKWHGNSIILRKTIQNRSIKHSWIIIRPATGNAHYDVYRLTAERKHVKDKSSIR